MNNLSGSEQVAVLGVIAPAVLAAQANVSGYVNIKGFENILIIVQTGVLGALATVDVTLQQATTSVGGGPAKALAKTVTQLTKAANDANQVLINVRAEEFDVNNGFDWLQVTVTVAEAGSAGSVVILGLNPRYGPARLGNAASVAQIVA